MVLLATSQYALLKHSQAFVDLRGWFCLSDAKREAMVDYGSGTISSLDQAFTAIGALIFLLGPSRDPSGADALVLARVGHFGAAA